MVVACVVVAVVVALAVWWAVHAWWWDVQTRGRRLPPGSMGWPLLGESLDLVFRLGYSNRPLPFFDQRQARHGSLFKSHLFGEPVVVSTSPAINSFVLQKEGVLFRLAYPSTFLRIFGTITHDQVHAQLRRRFMCIVGPTALRHYVSDIEESVLTTLSTWERLPIVLLHKEAHVISFDLAVKRLISLSTKDEEVQLMMQNFSAFNAALLSLPINLPGTSFNIGLKGRAKVVHLLQSIISQRVNARRSQSSHTDSPKDLLDALLEEETADGKILTRDLIVDVMVAVLFAAYETTATSLTFVLMLLSKHQDVLDKLLIEHMAIKRKKGQINNQALTWEDYKSMLYTKDVIYETLRLANVAPFVYRQALRDVEIEGFFIPKGWKVILSLSSSHVDPINYKEPLKFNPTRWKDGSNSKESFMPFGGGSRLCVGNDLTILQISIFLHHFLTKYNWSEVKNDQLIRSLGVKFKNGYPIKVTKR